MHTLFESAQTANFFLGLTVHGTSNSKGLSQFSVWIFLPKKSLTKILHTNVRTRSYFKNNTMLTKQL